MSHTMVQLKGTALKSLGLGGKEFWFLLKHTLLYLAFAKLTVHQWVPRAQNSVWDMEDAQRMTLSNDG